MSRKIKEHHKFNERKPQKVQTKVKLNTLRYLQTKASVKQTIQQIMLCIFYSSVSVLSEKNML